MDKRDFSQVKRIVIKVGSGVLTHNNQLNIGIIRSISRQVDTLLRRNIQVIIVSSGAMAAGVSKIGLKKRPVEIPQRQAVSSVRQAGLIMEYEQAFLNYNRKVAQVLLTRSDLCDRRRYLNARNTLYTLLEWDIIPVINENDSVVTEELKFGDNDNLGAMITLLLNADLMINLTDIDGLYNKDPRIFPDAELVHVVTTIDDEIEKTAGNIAGPLGTGGMLSKIKAAGKLTSAGIPMVIAGGAMPDIIPDIMDNKPRGTYFVPKNGKLSSRKQWIAFTVKPEGRIYLDQGAEEAVINRGKSILPSGVTDVADEFKVGSPIEFIGVNGNVLGVGLANYSASEIRKIMGVKSHQIETILEHKSYDEVIHRNNLVMT